MRFCPFLITRRSLRSPHRVTVVGRVFPKTIPNRVVLLLVKSSIALEYCVYNYIHYFSPNARSRCFWATTDALCRIVFSPTRKWVTRSIHTTQSRITIKLPARERFHSFSLDRNSGDMQTRRPIFPFLWSSSDPFQAKQNRLLRRRVMMMPFRMETIKTRKRTAAALAWLLKLCATVIFQWVDCCMLAHSKTSHKRWINDFTFLFAAFDSLHCVSTTTYDSLWSFECLCIEENFFMTSQIVIGIIAWDCSLAAPSRTVEMCVQRSFSWAWVY